jgi:hypothetical protein
MTDGFFIDSDGENDTSIFGRLQNKIVKNQINCINDNLKVITITMNRDLIDKEGLTSEFLKKLIFEDSLNQFIQKMRDIAKNSSKKIRIAASDIRVPIEGHIEHEDNVLTADSMKSIYELNGMADHLYDDLLFFMTRERVVGGSNKNAKDNLVYSDAKLVSKKDVIHSLMSKIFISDSKLTGPQKKCQKKKKLQYVLFCIITLKEEEYNDNDRNRLTNMSDFFISKDDYDTSNDDNNNTYDNDDNNSNNGSSSNDNDNDNNQSNYISDKYDGNENRLIQVCVYIYVCTYMHLYTYIFICMYICIYIL